MDEFDLSERTVSVPFDAPISIIFDQESGSLMIQNAPVNPNSQTIIMRAVFSPGAVQQLLGNLRKIEDAVKRTEEKPAETNFLDKTNIL